MIEQRRQTRYDHLSTIEFTVGNKDTTIHKAVTINLSHSGLGAYIFSALPEGQNILIKSKLPIDCSTACIRWIRQENAHFFKVGMMCNGRPSPASEIRE